VFADLFVSGVFVSESSILWIGQSVILIVTKNPIFDITFLDSLRVELYSLEGEKST
jgi:hypothetical protein